MKQKKGVSVVVSTILLILITFAAVGILWAFILPMVKESLEKGKSCFELRDYAEVIQSDYTCYTPNETKLMISRGMENYTIKGFRVGIVSEGSSKAYDITPENPDNVKMRDGTDSTNEIEIPGLGEAQTYFFDIPNGERVELGIITENGKICKINSYKIPKC